MLLLKFIQGGRGAGGGGEGGGGGGGGFCSTTLFKTNIVQLNKYISCK